MLKSKTQTLTQDVMATDVNVKDEILKSYCQTTLCSFC